MKPRSDSSNPTFGSLEDSARNGFACLFSTSDEYEAALISARRAEGRYAKPSPWPMIAFWVYAAAIVATVIFFAV